MSKEFDKEFQKVEETTKKQAKFLPLSLSELMQKQFAPTKWLVHNLVQDRGITMVSANAGSYKTWLILYLGLKICEGEKVFGHFDVEKTGVWLIDAEMNEKMLKDRLSQLTTNTYLPFYITSEKEFPVNEENINWLVTKALELNVKLIIMDSFIRVANIQDENSSVQVAGFFAKLKALQNNGISVLLTHHHRKGFSEGWGDEMRGSSDIRASVDCHISLSRYRNEKKLTIQQTKLRVEEELSKFEVEFVEDQESKQKDFKYLGDVTEEPKLSQKDLAKTSISTLLGNDKYTQAEIKKILKESNIEVGENNVEKAVKELVTENILTVYKEGNTQYYQIIKSTVV